LPQTDPALLLIQGSDGQTQGTAFAAPSAGIDQKTYSGKYADAHSPHPNLRTDIVDMNYLAVAAHKNADRQEHRTLGALHGPFRPSAQENYLITTV
jgi:hypothetical protein